MLQMLMYLYTLLKTITVNLLGQKGIHAFWESRLPELFSEDYDYLVGTANYKYSVLDFAWETVESSYTALDSVLGFDKLLSDILIMIDNIPMRKEDRKL